MECESQPDTVATSDADLDLIIQQLAAGMHHLPEDAIRAARQQRDRIIPKLIDVLRNTSSDARAGKKSKGNAHFFALFLLTEFQAKEALPAILDAVSLPDRLAWDLFGDAVTSMLSRTLAVLAGDTPEFIDAMIDDRSLSEYVRWEAAQTFTYLVRDGRMSRDAAVARLHQHLLRAIDNSDGDIVTPLIDILIVFCPQEAYADIERAYELDLADPFIVAFNDVKRSIAAGEAGIRTELDRRLPTAIEDTIGELRDWACFAAAPPKPSLASSPVPHFAVDSEQPEPAADSFEPDAPIEPVGTIESHTPHIGRNDPCPCGSGKKFKKCCRGKLGVTD